MSRQRRSSSVSRRPRPRPTRGPTPRPSRGQGNKPPSGTAVGWIILIVGGGILLLAIISAIVFMWFGRDPSDSAISQADQAPAVVTETTPPPAQVEPPTTTTEIIAPDPTEERPPPRPPPPHEFRKLEEYMIRLINENRQANGLSKVVWDSTASMSGQQHAHEMAGHNYMSHWNLEGYGPDHRYALVGGQDSVWENVYKYSGPAPASPKEWREYISNAQASLMDSEGHRANILAPERTHIGIGIGYNPGEGVLTIAQEFVNRYVVLRPLPKNMFSLGDTIIIKGRVDNRAKNPLINLAYEPFPAPQTVTELRDGPGTYESPAEFYEAINLEVDNKGRFEEAITLNNNNQAGLYHIRIWVETAFGQVAANDLVIMVR